jgi:hypothetical protein
LYPVSAEYPHKLTRDAMKGCCGEHGYICEFHEGFNDGVEALNALLDEHLGEVLAEAIARNDVKYPAALREKADALEGSGT